jgi:hypothetical protein
MQLAMPDTNAQRLLREAPSDFSNGLELSANRQIAQSCMDISSFAPRMSRYRGLKGYIARLTARAILFLSCFITGRQTQFNQAVLSMVCDLMSDLRMHILDQENCALHQEQIRREQEARIRALEEKVTLLTRRAG